MTFELEESYCSWNSLRASRYTPVRNFPWLQRRSFWREKGQGLDAKFFFTERVPGKKRSLSSSYMITGHCAMGASWFICDWVFLLLKFKFLSTTPPSSARNHNPPPRSPLHPDTLNLVPRASPLSFPPLSLQGTHFCVWTSVCNCIGWKFEPSFLWSLMGRCAC